MHLREFARMRLALPFLIGAASAGCDDLGLGSDPTVSLSFAGSGAGAAGMAAALVADTIIGGGHTLDLQSVDITFSELTLERAEGAMGGDSDGDSESDSDSDGSSNERFRSGSATVSLPLNGGVVTPISTSLPAGSYEELEADIAAIRLRGTYDGHAFDVSVPLDAELEMVFQPPFVVDSEDDRLNITIAIDVHSWLRSFDGTPVDPRILATSSSARELFRDRVKLSFRAFEDSDRDADDADSDSDSDSN